MRGIAAVPAETARMPSPNNGKICYIELPAADVAASSEFYRKVFGWTLRKRGDGVQAFDDATDQVSGAFLPDRSPAQQPGLIVYIMVDDAAACCEAIVAAGGVIVKPIDPAEHETYAHFRDPGGNLLGIYQSRS